MAKKRFFKDWQRLVGLISHSQSAVKGQRERFHPANPASHVLFFFQLVRVEIGLRNMFLFAPLPAFQQLPRFE